MTAITWASKSGRATRPQAFGSSMIARPKALGFGARTRSSWVRRLDPWLLGLAFKRGPKLLDLALQQDPFKLDQTSLIFLLILKILLFVS